MKKCYSLLMASTVCLASVATAATTEKTLPAPGPTFKSPQTLSLADAAKNAGAKPGQMQSPSFTPPAGEWTLLGNATWYEDLLTPFNEVDNGLSWEVPIYQSVTNPGYYRIAPYVEGSPIADIMEMGDPDAIFYINATDPAKVYIDGDVVLYNSFLISQIAPENDWKDQAFYGTFTDDVFEFPEQSFALQVQGSWHYSNVNGDFKISLPGAVAKDYSISAYAPLCAENNSLTAELTLGADVSTVKYAVVPGFYPSNANNNAVVAAQGETLPEGENTIQLSADKPGMYTLMVTTLSGTVPKKGAARSFFILDDDADNWETLPGKAQYTEGFFSGIFKDFETETLGVTVQEHKTKKGYYRLEEPYSTHSVMNAISHDSHRHYMYIDATNPQRVFIEASPLGVDDEEVGEIYGWSYAHYYIINNAAEDAATKGYYGTKTGNVISMPDESLLISMSRYQNGELFYTGKGFKVTLPDNSAVSEIHSDNDAEAEYFNLQGIRVSEPANGLYIRKAGGETSKVIL